MKKIFVLVAAAMISVTVFAQQQRQGGQNERAQRTPAELAKSQADMMKTRLALTDEQYAKALPVYEKYAKLQHELREKRRSEGETGPPSEELREQFRKLADERTAELMKIFDEKQRKLYEEFINAERERGPNRRGGRPQQ